MEVSNNVLLLGLCGWNGIPSGPPALAALGVPEELLGALGLALAPELLLEFPDGLASGSTETGGNLAKFSLVAAGIPKIAVIHKPRLTTTPTATMVTPAPDNPLSLRFTFSPPTQYHDFLIIKVVRAV
jgi:hypothetical protein